MKHMKYLLLLVLLAPLSILVLAQEKSNEAETGIGKRNWLVGGTLSLSEFSSFNNIVFTVNPKAGYFVGEKFALGLNARYHYDGVYNNSTLSGGPFARYYFINTKFAPFVEADYNLGWSKTHYPAFDEYREERSHIYGVGIGLNYFIVKNVALEGIIKYSRYDENNSGNINLNLGFQIFLNRKKR